MWICGHGMLLILMRTSVEMAFFSGGCMHRWFHPRNQKHPLPSTVYITAAHGKFRKSSKIRGNPAKAMDFASFAIISATYLGLYLAWKCETQQTCKQTLKQLPRRQEIHWSHDHEICHNETTFLVSVNETAKWKKKIFQKTSKSNK